MSDLDIALAIVATLERQGGYFVGDPEAAMRASPDHFLITQKQRAVCERNGPMVFQLWEETQRFYQAVVSGRIVGFDWVAEAIEGPLTSHQRWVQRQIALAEYEGPLFARADLSSIWFLVEIQERLGGLGLMESWLRAIRSVLPGRSGELIGQRLVAEPFAQTVRQATRKEAPVVALIAPEAYLDEQNYLAMRLGQEGVTAVVVPKGRLSLLKSRGRKLYFSGGLPIDLLYRREENAASLAQTGEGMNIIEAALAGNLVVEPPLNMLYDTKVPLALVHDPRLKECFSPKVQGIIPPTALMPASMEEEFFFGGRITTLDDILALSNSQRAVVVKYAGPSIEYGFGGRAVYNLRASRQKAKNVLDYGLSQVRLGHPWVVQVMDETRFPTRYLGDGRLECKTGVAGRIMFFYRRLPGGGKEMFAACSTNRPHWKAIGSPESIFQEVRVDLPRWRTLVGRLWG